MFEVIANYVVTAGIAKLLIVLYFLVVYDPSQDPLRKTYFAYVISSKPDRHDLPAGPVEYA